MKNNIIFWVITIVFFRFYFFILRWIWNSWIPFNITTDILALFILVVVLIPLSAISAEKTIKIIKSVE